MEIDTARYLMKKDKAPSHEKAAVVNLFLEYIGEPENKKYSYGYWLRKIGKCSFGDAMQILKELESLPIKYSKAGTVVNKLKKINEKKIPKNTSVSKVSHA